MTNSQMSGQQRGTPEAAAGRSAERPPAYRRHIFSLLLLTSGFCGISYEVLYGRILGNLIGDQFAVSAAILLTFLAGIGLGTLFAHRLWPYLWAVEGAIGLYAMTIAAGSGLLDSFIFTAFADSRLQLWALLGVCIGLVLAPAFLIGTSLPLFAGYMSRLVEGLVFSRVYAVYNLGAAIVVLLIEFGLIRSLGIRGGTVAIGILNLLVGATLYFKYADLRKRSAVRAGWETAINFPRRQIGALVLLSVGSAVFQLNMVKLGECLFGPFRETFALILTLVFLGLAAGSTLVRFLHLSFDVVVMLVLLGLMWMLGGFSWCSQIYATWNADASEHYWLLVGLKLSLLAVLMLGPALAFGAAIPALITRQRDVARESGLLLFASSMGNVGGFLVMVLYLHQRLDYGVILIVVAGLSAVALAVHGPVLAYRSLLALVLVVFCIFLHKHYWDEGLLYLGHTAFDSKEELAEEQSELESLEVFKAPRDVFSIVWKDDSPYFFINGYVSMVLDSPWEPIVGGLSAVFSPGTDRALILGVGSGNTAGVVGLLFDRTDGVEINGAVLDNLQRMEPYNFDILHNPRVRLIHDDAIRYVKGTDARYSLIINTVTSPLYFSSAKLYTLDFLTSVRSRLLSAGVYVTWVDSRVGERGIEIMLKTLGEAFPYCGLAYVRSSYFLLLCSESPLHVRQPEIVARHPVLGPHFSDEFEIDPALLAYAFMHPNAPALVGNPDTPVNTLDFPALEFEMTRLRERGYRAFQLRLRDAMNLDEVKSALTPELDFNPFNLVIHAENILGDSRYTRQWERLLRGEVSNYDEQHFRASIGREEGELTADELHKLGYRLLKADAYEEAIVAFRKALARNPERDNSYFNLGACYEKLGKYEEALVNYRAELNVDPEDGDVPYRVGRVLVKMGRNEEALGELREATKLTPKSWIFYYLGRAYEGLGRNSLAAKAYSEAIKLDVENDSARKALESLGIE